MAKALHYMNQFYKGKSDDKQHHYYRHKTSDFAALHYRYFCDFVTSGVRSGIEVDQPEPGPEATSESDEEGIGILDISGSGFGRDQADDPLLQEARSNVVEVNGSTQVHQLINDENVTPIQNQYAIDIEEQIAFSLEQKQLSNFLKKIKYSFDSNEPVALFNDDGEFVYKYKITNWIHEDGMHMIYKDVGNFTPWAPEDQQFQIDIEAITWKFSNGVPESRCSGPCLPGSRKKFGSSIHKCCYECVTCPEGEISNSSDSENCIKCPDDEWPNEKKDRCVPNLVEFLSYTDDTIVSIFSSVSISCCLMTGLILGIFIQYQDTPIVKANNLNLSYLLLVSIMLSFLCVFLFLGRPVDVTCMLRVTSFGVIFSVAVSSLLAKSIMVCIAFKSTKPGSSWKKWMGAGFPISILLMFSLIQVIICVTWLSISPPFQDLDTHSYQGKIIIQCNEGSVIGFYSVLGYTGLLVAVSFIIAFLARTLPDTFNEAQYITFSMLVFCSVWIAMIPAYLSTKGKDMVAVEIFAIMASSSGLLGCIFFPKCYIILFRPDLNTKIGLLKNKEK
ncbi:vomeronasal type-2 receptor 26-like [Rana temporaria]|uniref:vomeronasal type-2 receptor 26-like n=1 Tax=Rana temporaria TaxID=8407 RepID=UPI001AAC7E80|nr:vomeronasal type-2 receptor 26-like [Rana temporaria]